MSAPVLELFAKLGLDSKDFDKGLDDARGKSSDFASSFVNAFATITKVSAAAFAAVTTATVALGKNAVQSYANYEQLAGGVEKLFGDASDTVLEFANKAFMTSGMATNDYLETATSFSAALLKSLGGDAQKAAEITDVAMRAISDNVNTFGTNIESVEGAFMALSKSNYTLLDNLKLGYAGNAQGMMELINDSGILGYTLTNTSQLAEVGFANMVLAIQKVQEQQNIAGTTAKEAMTTIEGSASATKAAWQNVILAIGRGEGLGDALGGLTDALFGTGETSDGKATGLLNQLIPRIETAFEGIGDFVSKAAPYVTEKLPELVETIIPAVISSASSVFGSLVSAIPELFQTLVDLVMTQGLALIQSLSEGFLTGIPEFLAQALPALLSFTEELRNNFGTIVDAGLELIMNLVNGLIAGMPDLIAYVPEIITNIAGLINDNMPKILETGFNIIIALIQGIISNIPNLIANAGKIVEAIVSVITAMNWVNLGSKIIQLFVNGIKALFSLPVEAFKNIGRSVIQTLRDGFSWSGLGSNIINGIVSGIKGAGNAIKDTLLGFARDAWKSVKDFFGISSPSKLMRDTVGKWIPEGIAVGIEGNADSVFDAMSNLSADTADSFGTDVFENAPATRGAGGIGSMIFNIYGAEGQSPEEIAMAVRDIIISEEERNNLVYA